MAHAGRPHWDTLHTRDVATLGAEYPRFHGVVAVRDSLDPERPFTKAYLDRVLGA